MAGGAAGGHWSPSGSTAACGARRRGHMGDLPFITVAADGTSKETLTAPRLTDLASSTGMR